MGKKSDKKGREMGSKPRELGYNAIQIIDMASMANSMVMQHLASILTNDLTAEAILKAVGLAIKEASEVQKNLTDVRYLGK